MGAGTRWTWRCHHRRTSGARHSSVAWWATPGPIMPADLRGPLTALRAGWTPRPTGTPARPACYVAPAPRPASDSVVVRTPDVHLSGRAEPAPLAEEDLVERARTDPDAFAELYRRYVNRVHAFVYRRSRSIEVADEITSSTFERALRGLPTFRWREGGFKAWIYRIAANELASHYRRTQRQHTDRGQRAAQQLHDAVAPEDPPITPEHGELVLEALSRLNERYQRVITLRYLAGLSPEEAAQAMGLNKATLAVVLHRALGALRRAMDDLGHTDRARP